MTYQQRNPFDLPVDGISDRYCTMPELMEQFRAAEAALDHERAFRILNQAVRSGYPPARLAMARFLKNTPQLRMPRQERYARCEQLYREILNSSGLSRRRAATLSTELAGLYESANRHLGCMGALLKAKRLGADIPQQDLQRCAGKISRMDINSFCNYLQDCYDLGSELAFAGSLSNAEIFLLESSASSNDALAGRSCLLLAEIYRARSAEAPAYSEEAKRMYRMACEKGFPEYLEAAPKKHPTKKNAHRAV